MKASLAKAHSNSRLPIAFVLLLLAALHTYGIGIIRIGHIEIAPWDVTTVAIGLLWLAYLSKARLPFNRDSMAALLLAMLFAIWVCFEAFRSPQPVRGLTMLLILLRDIVIFLIIGSMMGQMTDLNRLNRAIFAFGTALACVSILIFSGAVQNYVAIANNPSLWYPEVGYVLDQGGILRLTGFAKDPNFYSIWLSLSFFTGFSIPAPRSWTKWAGLGVIGLSLLLAASRTFIAAFVLSSLLIAFLIMINTRTLKRPWPYMRSIGLSIGIVGIAALIWSLVKGNLFHSLVARFELIEASPRFEAWNVLLEQGFKNIVFGMGLRGSEQLLHDFYSHNSYLDLLVETGLVGFLLWFTFAFFISIKGIKSLQRPGVAPWVHAWFLLLLMFVTFSLVYNPFFWLLSAVIVSQRGQK